jgi:phosphonopyruvate decarboxylase
LSKLDISFFTGVPDSLLKDICAYVTDTLADENHKIAANEGSAVGLAIGYHISSKKLALVYMQNSGLGNAVNPITSLADKKIYSVPMMLLIGWRGEPGVKDEPQHIKQGMVTEKLLNLLDIPYVVIDKHTNDDEIYKIIEKQKEIAYKKMSPVALLVKKGTFLPYKKLSVAEDGTTSTTANAMSRTEVIDYYVRLKLNHIVVSTTGVTSRELLASRKRNERNSSGDFLTVGGMGHASQIALGIAMNKKSTKIICLDGDGALLMHMGSLASIADSGSKNFHYILLNNSVHDSVGGQPIAARNSDFLKAAESLGFKKTYKINNKEELPKLIEIFEENGPTFIEIIIKPGFPSDLIRPDKTPLENKSSFEEYLKKCT